VPKNREGGGKESQKGAKEGVADRTQTNQIGNDNALVRKSDRGDAKKEAAKTLWEPGQAKYQ